MNEKSKDKELNFENQPQVSLLKKFSYVYICFGLLSYL